LDVYSVTNIALVVIGYAQLVVCWTTNNTRTISRLYRTTNKGTGTGDKGTQVTMKQTTLNIEQGKLNIAYPNHTRSSIFLFS